MSAESRDGLVNHEQDAGSDEKPVVFERLVPILFVADLPAERDFYVRLGFTVTYQGPEFADFVALGHGSLEFGISRREGFTTDLPERVLTWQFGIKDVDAITRQLATAGMTFREERITPREDWTYRVLHLHTPNGYHLMLEGPAE